MKTIVRLSKETIEQIAAGEVVERPASIVKELLENAVDAGATHIFAEIKDGGLSLIRVTDDGEGMDHTQLPLAFAAHATSKIRDVEDILHVHTFGFRGEALSSIAAVSELECITKTEESLTGTRYVMRGGEETVCEEIGSPDGTTMIVRDLFYNTPARKKFLKSPSTEAQKVNSMVEKIVLSHPDICWSYAQDGKSILSTRGAGLKDTIYDVYGKWVTKHLIPVSYQDLDVTIGGFVASPSYTRGNRGMELYFINGRMITDRVIQQAIEEGYHGMLMHHAYPFTVLLIETDPSYYDVNVHPAKTEVRFSDEKKIFDAVRDAVRKALSAKDLSKMPDVEKKQPSPSEAKREYTYADRPFETQYRSVREEEERMVSVQADRSAMDITESSASLPDDISVEQETHTSGIKQSAIAYYGQVFDTYLLFCVDDRFLLVDQHAAHEKVLYERLVRTYHDQDAYTQQLLVPKRIPLDAEGMARFTERAKILSSFGFSARKEDAYTVLLDAVPYHLGSAVTAEDVFFSVLDAPFDEQDKMDIPSYASRIALEACKAAIKGGGSIDAREAMTLFDALMDCDDPYHCPHGRPTIVKWTKRDLEKLFKRIV